jgi:hypothetical protein
MSISRWDIIGAERLGSSARGCRASRAAKFGVFKSAARWLWLNTFLIGWETFEERHAGKRGHPRDAQDAGHVNTTSV